MAFTLGAGESSAPVRRGRAAGRPAWAIALLLATLAVPAARDVAALERTAAVAVALVDGSPYLLGDLNGELYFGFQSQLWKSDGTPAGTILLSAATPLGPHHETSGPGCPPFCLEHDPEGGSAGGALFLAADDGVHGYELWRSDGTPAGTHLVKDGGATPFDPRGLVAVNGLMFFVRGDAQCSTPCELWRSDGTEAGTVPLAGVAMHPLTGAEVNGRLLFQNGADLWTSDGTVGGTGLLVSGAQFQRASGGRAFFTTPTQLWATDGTVPGTVPLTGFPVVFHTCVSGACYFSKATVSGWEGVWRTDGTPGGTTELTSILLSPSLPELVDVSGTVYFTYGDQLWKTNGTPAGTALVATATAPRGLASAYGRLFFISDGQLWTSDGTTAGTAAVESFGAGQSLAAVVVLDGRLLLKVEGPRCVEVNCRQDWRLYRSDGTAGGAAPVADFAQTLVNCPTPLCTALTLSPPSSTVIDGKWFFVTKDSLSYSPGLWMATHVFFQDVPPDYWAFAWVEDLAEAGITGGCGPERYCPGEAVNRAQMAVFLERAMKGSSFSPPPATGAVFADVPATH